MNHIKKITLLLILSCMSTARLWAATQVELTTGTPAFTENISAKAFDRETGTFYVTTAAAMGAPNAGKTLAMAGPTATEFTGLAATPADCVIHSNNGVGAGVGPVNVISSPLLSLLDGDNKKFLVAIPDGAGGNNTVNVFNAETGAFIARSGALQTNGVADIALAADNTGLRLCTGTASAATVGEKGRAFVYVYPVGHLAGFLGSSVRQVRINLSTGVVDAAVPGDVIPLERTCVVLGNVANADTHGWVNDLYWDDELKVLYAGLSVISSNSGANQHTYGLVKTTINPANGNLNVFAAVYGVNVPGPQLDPGGDAVRVNTVFVVSTADAAAWGGTGRVAINKIRGMKTSTGLKYLIVNGGAARRDTNFSLETFISRVYALRIANDPTAVDDVRGNIVRNDNGAILPVNWNVSSPAVNLADPDPLGATEVGTTTLRTVSGGINFISDMEVVGDTVYASVGLGDDPGVWSSRALFNHQGVIIGWTPWERVFKSENDGWDNAAIPVAQPNENADKANFIAVDGKAGVVWQVNQTAGGNPQIVRRTTWSVPIAAAAGTGLAARLNSDLAEGSTAVLDLPTGTPGLGAVANVHNSFALFGGNGKVVFAQTKYGNAFNETVDFSPATRYKVTTLAGAGYVRALGYSRVDVGAGTNNYFFAGTDNGLYVWALTHNLPANQTGFNNAAGFTDLNTLPFGGTYSWQKMTFAGNNITGAVTAIESNGTHLFVVEQDVSTVGAIVSKLHKIQIAANVGLMVQAGATHVIIAQSGLYGIPDKTIFTGFAVVSSTGARDYSFGLLTTSSGLYGSDGTIHDFDPAANVWVAVDATKAFTLEKGIKRVPTVAPDVDGKGQCPSVASFANEGSGYWQKSALNNVGIDWAAGHAWNLSQLKAYVNASAANGGSGLTYLDRLTTFWTDGGRRLFATYDPTVSGNTLQSMPFATTEWGMSGPEIIAELADVSCINWIENISGSGILMVGTDKGVATLE